jgi:uncharacterized protein
MSREFNPSRFLRFVRRRDGWAVYHSLLGNLAVLDTAGKQFLEAFSESAAIEEAAQTFPSFSGERLRSYANRLISRVFLIPAGADDYSLIEENRRWRQANLSTGYLVRGLQLVTTNSCNYGCQYCFMNQQSEERNPGWTTPAEPMSFEVAERSIRGMLDLLQRNGHKHLFLEFFGGEPLMNWQVIRHVLATFGNQPEPDMGISYSVTTNGTLITREIAELLERYHVTVTISVDIPTKLIGLPVISAKSGDRIQKVLSILREVGNTVTFNSVLTQSNLECVDGHELIDFCKRNGVKAVGLILDLDLPFYRNAGNRDRVLEILLDTHRYGNQMGVRVGGYWYQIFSQIIGEQPINLRSGYKTCAATGVKISVEPDGSVYMCKCTSNRMGNVGNVVQILQSETYADYAMRAYRHADACAGCEIEGFCSGVCMGSFENVFGRKGMVEEGACQVFRKITRDLIIDLPADHVAKLSLEGDSVC